MSNTTILAIATISVTLCCIFVIFCYNIFKKSNFLIKQKISQNLGGNPIFMDFKSKEKKLLNNTVIRTGLIPLSAIALFGATIFYWNSRSYGLTLECQGTPIATISNEAVYEKANDMIRDQLSSKDKSEINNTNTQIKVSPINTSECCESPSEIKDKIIEKSQSIIAEGYGIYINGKLITVGKYEKELEKIKNSILSEAKEKNSEANVEFKEKFEIKKGIFSPEEIKSDEDIKKILVDGIETFSQYTVKEEDTVLSIAEQFGMSPKELLSLNNAKENSIKVGDKLTIKKVKKVLHINIFKIVKEEVEITANVETTEDPEKFKGTEEVIQEGKNGRELVTYKVEYDKDGKEIGKIEVERKIIEESITKKVKIGTKKEIDGFLWPAPCSHKITSPYGYRSDPHGRHFTSFHSGIDIAGAGIADRTVIASKSGKVIYAKNSSKGYGNHIIIEHENGMQTLYAHLESINVSEGQKVSQGDSIGIIGTTGDSTGLHLHFEVRVNGSTKDPQQYVKANQ